MCLRDDPYGGWRVFNFNFKKWPELRQGFFSCIKKGDLWPWNALLWVDPNSMNTSKIVTSSPQKKTAFNLFQPNKQTNKQTNERTNERTSKKCVVLPTRCRLSPLLWRGLLLWRPIGNSSTTQHQSSCHALVEHTAVAILVGTGRSYHKPVIGRCPRRKNCSNHI